MYLFIILDESVELGFYNPAWHISLETLKAASAYEKDSVNSVECEYTCLMEDRMNCTYALFVGSNQKCHLGSSDAEDQATIAITDEDSLLIKTGK